MLWQKLLVIHQNPDFSSSIVMATQGRDYISQPPLQQGIAMWLRFGQWDGSVSHGSFLPPSLKRLLWSLRLLFAFFFLLALYIRLWTHSHLLGCGKRGKKKSSRTKGKIIKLNTTNTITSNNNSYSFTECLVCA